MKNQKLSIKILIIVVVGMFLMGTTIAFANKSKIKVEDLEGSRSEIGDMNFILQSRKGSYETDEIIINKDKETLKKRAKQGNNTTNLTKENIDHRDFLAYGYGKQNLFENEDEIGSVYVSHSYYDDESYDLSATINIKNKKKDKINDYEIVLEDRGTTNRSDLIVSVPIKADKNTLYIAVLVGMGNSYEDYNSTVLNLYKVNLQNKTSKKILSKDYDKKDISLIVDNVNFGFSKGNKAYFLVNKDDNNFNSYLLEFDIISKEINYIDLKDAVYGVNQYNLDGDKILLISDHENTGSDAKAILVDLKNRKVEYNYRLELNYGADEIGALQVRRDNGKIYLILMEFTSEESRLYNKYFLHVINEKDNKILYKGQLKLNTAYPVVGGIVKEDEL